MRHCHVCELAEKRELDGTLNGLLQAGANYCVAVRAQQDGIAVCQRRCQRFTALKAADQPGRGVDGRTAGGKKFSIHVDGTKAALDDAEKRAPFRMRVANTHHFGTPAQDARMNRPFVW